MSRKRAGDHREVVIAAKQVMRNSFAERARRQATIAHCENREMKITSAQRRAITSAFDDARIKMASRTRRAIHDCGNMTDELVTHEYVLCNTLLLGNFLMVVAASSGKLQAPSGCSRQALVHELSIAQSLIDLASEAAASEEAGRVTRLYIKIGAGRGGQGGAAFLLRAGCRRYRRAKAARWKSTTSA